jgi:hypothetical protein
MSSARSVLVLSLRLSLVLLKVKLGQERNLHGYEMGDWVGQLFPCCGVWCRQLFRFIWKEMGGRDDEIVNLYI